MFRCDSSSLPFPSYMVEVLYGQCQDGIFISPCGNMALSRRGRGGKGGKSKRFIAAALWQKKKGKGKWFIFFFLLPGKTAEHAARPIDNYHSPPSSPCYYRRGANQCLHKNQRKGRNLPNIFRNCERTLLSLFLPGYFSCGRHLHSVDFLFPPLEGEEEHAV